MKSKAISLMVIFLLILASSVGPADAQRDQAFQIGVWFSPKGGCTEAIIKEVDQARRQVVVLAYLLTANPIVKSLADARKRGVDVSVVLDKGQYGPIEEQDVATLLAAGVKVYMDEQHGQAHNKIMVIDGSTVITGSFNFTVAAEQQNTENLLIIKRPDVAALYLKEANAHVQHARAMQRP